MAFYRKKPVVVEAIQFTGENNNDVFNFTGGTAYVNYMDGSPAKEIIIPTLEGEMKAIPTDFIIKGVKGEFYPCKEDIFHTTYEVAPTVIDNTNRTSNI